MPNGYRMKNMLYLKNCMNPGTEPVNRQTKYEYLITSVVLHATSMVEYAMLFAGTEGNWSQMAQTRRKRLATCIAVVKTDALTSPALRC